MDSGLSDCSRCEEDSNSSFNSMDSFTAKKLHTTLSTCDIQLSKRIASLEAENERLRIDAENARIEANARYASNQALKSKIAELFVEAHNSLQERQKLQKALNDANQRLINAENSSKWYACKWYDIQSYKKAHNRSINEDIPNGHLQFLENNRQLACCSDGEKTSVDNEVSIGELSKKLSRTCGYTVAESNFFKEGPPALHECKSRKTKQCKKKTHTEPTTLDKHSASNEIFEDSMEIVSPDRYSWLLFWMNKNLEELEAEKKNILVELGETRNDLFKLRNDNEQLQQCVLSSKYEQIQVDESICYLSLQLDKLISEYKLLKSRIFEAEHESITVQDVLNDNKHLKPLSCTANGSFFEKSEVEKRSVYALTNERGKDQSENRLRTEALQRDERMNSMRDCLRRALERNEVIYQEAHRKLRDWEELEERFKMKILDESIDEGYGDGNSAAIPGSTDLPSSPQFDTVLIKSAVGVLSRSKNFMAPLEHSLEQLRLNIGTFRQRVATETK